MLLGGWLVVCNLHISTYVPINCYLSFTAVCTVCNWSSQILYNDHATSKLWCLSWKWTQKPYRVSLPEPCILATHTHVRVQHTQHAQHTHARAHTRNIHTHNTHTCAHTHTHTPHTHTRTAHTTPTHMPNAHTHTQGNPRKLGDVQDFLVSMFNSVRQDKTQEMYRHFTTATDTGNIKVVFNIVKDTILTKHIQDIMQI